MLSPRCSLAKSAYLLFPIDPLYFLLHLYITVFRGQIQDRWYVAAIYENALHLCPLPYPLPPKCPVDVKRGKSEYVDSP